MTSTLGISQPRSVDLLPPTLQTIPEAIGKNIARSRGHHPNGVRRIEQIAPDLVPAMAATIGDHTAPGCLHALRAAAALYQRLRGEHPPVVRHSGAESATLAYLAEIEARLAL